MNEIEIRNNSARVAQKFNAYVATNRERANVRVFLCGKALGTGSLEDKVGTHIRAYLWHRLEREIGGCQVFLGEHQRLIAEFDKAMGRQIRTVEDSKKTNLSRFEISLADWVHLVVILPESEGSLAELGMFSVATKLGTKLILLMNAKYENHESFINLGPVRSAKKIGARVHFVNYDFDNWGTIYDIVRQEVEDVVESLATESAFSRESD